MFTYQPHSPSGLAFIADARTKDDLDLDHAQNSRSVFQRYSMGTSALGKAAWNSTAKAALFDYREPLDKLPKKEKKAKYQQAKQDLMVWLETTRPNAVIVLQTLSRTIEESALNGTFVWDAIGGPGTMVTSQGTIWRGPFDIDFIPVLNYVGYDGITRWYIRRWMQMAASVATGRVTALSCPEKVIEPGHRALQLLQSYSSMSSISLDIESIPSKGTITAINLSDGITAVSMPWHPYDVYPAGHQQGLSEYPLGVEINQVIREIIANPDITKIGHNAAGYDKLELEAKGFVVGGSIEDTLLMHRVAHPQHRHGLQIACATELPVPPWKSLHRPVRKSEDSDEFWTAEPNGLRDYGCDDAFFSMKLFNALNWKLV